MALHSGLAESTARHAGRIAIEQTDGRAITYGELDTLSDRVRDRLHHMGVRPGDRVGLHLYKSIDAVVTVFGILKTGAAYVPVDVEAPAARAAFVLNDCTVAAVVSEAPVASELDAELRRLGSAPAWLVMDAGAADSRLDALLEREDRARPASRVPTIEPGPDALAYILYTSGSTGRPKGVMLSHGGAEAYVDWCRRTFAPTPSDRFSSHAPLHFDLSILDLYVPLGRGATLVLIGEAEGREPRALAPLIADRRITVWYSVPSILALLAQYGKLERHDYASLRLVLFAGEVFPVPSLRSLQRCWPRPRYFNLYGPTETNVCTYHELPAGVRPEGARSLPIGRACDHMACRVVDESGIDLPPGVEGELVVAGPSVMRGYWKMPDQNAAAFHFDERGDRWYRTGDLVVEDARDGYLFRGRLDRMVKRRGYRIEPGEIEAGLATHPAIREVAVVALKDEHSSPRIVAILSTTNGERLSIIELKRFCAGRLPRYMMPDAFEIVSELPRTSTGKIDYAALSASG